MRINIFLPFVIVSFVVIGLTSAFIDKKRTKNYLPVYVEILTPTADSFMLQLYFKSAFKKFKVETIGKKTAIEIKEEEIARVTRDYFSTTQMPSNDEFQNYISRNLDYKVNNLVIKFSIDSASNTIQDLEWRNRGIPIKLAKDNQKRTFNKLDIENIKLLKMQEFIQAITDSIMASAKLLTD